MKDIEISTYQEAGILLETVFDFIKEIYADRQKAGIDFWISTCTFEEYKAKVEKDGRTIFVACSYPDGRLLGTAALIIRQDKKNVQYGGMANCAVWRDSQRLGIGSMLVDAIKQKAIHEGCKYLKSKTATNAESSVRWHLGNGYLKTGLSSASSNHYFSYVFIMPLVETDSFYYRFGYKISYLLSCVRTKSIVRQDGSPTWFGGLLANLRKIVKTILALNRTRNS